MLQRVTNGHHPLAMPYGPRWRLVRKILHQYLTIKMCEDKHGLVRAVQVPSGWSDADVELWPSGAECGVDSDGAALLPIALLCVDADVLASFVRSTTSSSSPRTSTSELSATAPPSFSPSCTDNADRRSKVLSRIFTMS